MERKPDEKLTNEQIAQQLQSISGWTHDAAKQQIVKTFVRKNFVDGVGFIQAIAPIAEAQDHHPDILLSDYKNVKIMLSTHSAGGLTENDFTLAKAIDQIP